MGEDGGEVADGDGDFSSSCVCSIGHGAAKEVVSLLRHHKSPNGSSFPSDQLLVLVYVCLSLSFSASFPFFNRIFPIIVLHETQTHRSIHTYPFNHPPCPLVPRSSDLLN